MSVKIPMIKDKIIDYANDFYRANHRSPSVREIAAKLDVGKSTVHKYLVEMNENGEIGYDGKNIVTDVIERCDTSESVSAPVYGNVACGGPVTEEGYAEKFISLPQSIFGKGDFYILKAYGDSMVDAGIVPDSLVVVDKSIQPKKDDIVVVLNEDNENTLKQYKGKKNGKYTFAYMNETEYPDKTIEMDSFTSQGVARFIVREI